MLPVAVARSSSYNNAIRYVLPVLWMTSYFHIMAQTETQVTGEVCCRRLPCYIIVAHQYKAAGMKIETKQNTNGCNGTLFSDHSVTEGEHISSLNSYSTCIDRRCNQKCCFCDGGDAQSLIIRSLPSTTL